MQREEQGEGEGIVDFLMRNVYLQNKIDFYMGYRWLHLGSTQHNSSTSPLLPSATLLCPTTTASSPSPC